MQDFTLTVPLFELNNPGTQSNYESDTVSLALTAPGSGNTTLSYLADDLPEGLTINAASGVISGTVAVGAAQDGPYQVTVDAANATINTSQSFTWDIYSHLRLTNPGNQTNYEDDSVSLPLSATDDFSGSTLIFGAIGLPVGLAVDPYTGAISGTVGTGAAADGPYTVTALVTDGYYRAQQTFTWTVDQYVTLPQPADQNSIEGASVSLALGGTDTGGGTLSYGAVGLPPGLSLNTTSGVISGTIAAGDAAGGPYTVIVMAVDGTYSASQAFNWNVTGSPVTLAGLLDQTSNEGAPVTLALSASDSIGGSTLSYSATGLPAGLHIDPATGVISGTIAAGAAADGPYSVTIGAADGSYSADQTFNWNVNSPVSFTDPPDQTNNESDTVSLAVTASDAAEGTLTYGAFGLPPGLSINASTGLVSGTVSVGDAVNSPYAVTVMAEDGTYSNTESFNWNINSPVSLAAPADQANNEGDSVSLALSATDTIVDATLTYSASGLPAGLTLNTSTGLISGTVSYGGTLGAHGGGRGRHLQQHPDIRMGRQQPDHRHRPRHDQLQRRRRRLPGNQRRRHQLRAAGIDLQRLQPAGRAVDQLQHRPDLRDRQLLPDAGHVHIHHHRDRRHRHRRAAAGLDDQPHQRRGRRQPRHPEQHRWPDDHAGVAVELPTRGTAPSSGERAACRPAWPSIPPPASSPAPSARARMPRGRTTSPSRPLTAPTSTASISPGTWPVRSR